MINWKLRLKNRTTLAAIVGVVLLFIKQVTELFGFDFSAQLEQIADIAGTVLLLLAVVGILNDPTSRGIGDTSIAKQYKDPRNEKLNPIDFLKQDNDDGKNIAPEYSSKELEEFDTSEEFTDDSDEVAFDVADYEDNETRKRGASAYHDDEVLKESDENGSKSNETTSD